MWGEGEGLFKAKAVNELIRAIAPCQEEKEEEGTICLQFSPSTYDDDLIFTRAEKVRSLYCLLHSKHQTT